MPLEQWRLESINGRVGPIDSVCSENKLSSGRAQLTDGRARTSVAAARSDLLLRYLTATSAWRWLTGHLNRGIAVDGRRQLFSIISQRQRLASAGAALDGVLGQYGTPDIVGGGWGCGEETR